MTRKNIVFTAPKTAECLNAAVPEVTGHNVLVRMEYTVVSGGTERACIMGMPNAGENNFPTFSGRPTKNPQNFNPFNPPNPFNPKK